MATRKAIEVEGVSYRYPDGTVALSKVNLEVLEGEVVAIVGPNGAGKTTLLLHFNGLLRPYEGKVRVFGRDVEDLKTEELIKLVGVVFQDPDDQLFMPTLFDDVAFGPTNLGLSREEVEARVDDVLRKFELLDYKHKPPHHLSYGQRRKAALAAVLAMKPRVLALDEPTANLDPRGKRELLEVIEELVRREGLTVVIASHDTEFLSRLNGRAYVLNKTIVGGGPLHEVLEDEELLERAGLL